MHEQRRWLLALLGAVAVTVLSMSRVQFAFAPIRTSSRVSLLLRRRRYALALRCKSDSTHAYGQEASKPEYIDDFGDAAIEQFYKETLLLEGGGGPPPPGRIRDEIASYFVWLGPGRKEREATDADHEIAYNTMKKQMGFVLWRTWGGPMGETSDDGKGWVWLSKVMTSVGACLQIYTSVPYGTRPLLVARGDNIDALFDNINWAVVQERLDHPFMGMLATQASACERETQIGSRDDVEDTLDLSRWKVSQLREELRNLGVDDSGSKTELAQRLLAARSKVE